MRVMVTGAGGMTGTEVVRAANERGWDCIALTRADLDITDAAAVESVVAAERPDVVINTAAYTAVDAAENEPAEAMAINCEGAGHVARATSRSGAVIIHISTDYVFDGALRRPYLPDDAPAPINVYGASKLAGEIAVRSESPRHVIVRTSWLFSHAGRNFVRTMLRAASGSAELKVVDDQRGRPTSSADLAEALMTVAAEAVRDPSLAGTFHFANSGSATWYDFAKAIFELKEMPARVRPIPTTEFRTAARRPAWSVLDTTSFQQLFKVSPRSWRDALADTLAMCS